jgi:uncharacterized membrane protein (DUF106 family)
MGPEGARKVTSHPLAMILSYALSTGAGGGALVAWNQVENQQIEQQTVQRTVIEQQKKNEEKLEKLDQQTREIRDISIELRTLIKQRGRDQ